MNALPQGTVLIYKENRWFFLGLTGVLDGTVQVVQGTVMLVIGPQKVMGYSPQEWVLVYVDGKFYVTHKCTIGNHDFFEPLL